MRKAAGEYHGTFLDVEPDVWAEQYRSHHEAVEAFFADRDDLLVMRITEGDGYEALCPFLGLPDPGVPFPARHRGLEASLSGHFGERFNLVAGAVAMQPRVTGAAREAGLRI